MFDPMFTRLLRSCAHLGDFMRATQPMRPSRGHDVDGAATNNADHHGDQNAGSHHRPGDNHAQAQETYQAGVNYNCSVFSRGSLQLNLTLHVDNNTHTHLHIPGCGDGNDGNEGGDGGGNGDGHGHGSGDHLHNTSGSGNGDGDNDKGAPPPLPHREIPGNPGAGRVPTPHSTSDPKKRKTREEQADANKSEKKNKASLEASAQEDTGITRTSSADSNRTLILGQESQEPPECQENEQDSSSSQLLQGSTAAVKVSLPTGPKPASVSNASPDSGGPPSNSRFGALRRSKNFTEGDLQAAEAADEADES